MPTDRIRFIVAVFLDVGMASRPCDHSRVAFHHRSLFRQLLPVHIGGIATNSEPSPANPVPHTFVNRLWVWHGLFARNGFYKPAW